MKAWKEKTKCMLDIAENGSVMASVQVQVKGIKHEYPASAPFDKRMVWENKICLLDGRKFSVYVKQRGNSCGMERLEERQHNPISS